MMSDMMQDPKLLAALRKRAMMRQQGETGQPMESGEPGAVSPSAGSLAPAGAVSPSADPSAPSAGAPSPGGSKLEEMMASGRRAEERANADAAQMQPGGGGMMPPRMPPDAEAGQQAVGPKGPGGPRFNPEGQAGGNNPLLQILLKRRMGQAPEDEMN